MNNEELKNKMKKVKYNLEIVKNQLRNAQNILNQSITFDNESFKSDDMYTLNNKLNKQINNLETKIIPGINNV